MRWPLLAALLGPVLVGAMRLRQLPVRYRPSTRRQPKEARFGLGGDGDGDDTDWRDARAGASLLDRLGVAAGSAGPASPARDPASDARLLTSLESVPAVTMKTKPRCRGVSLADNSWLASGRGSLLSEESLNALFMYGPVVYAVRCLDSEEYDASVRKMMERYPKISRELAEQEVNMFLSDGNAYLATQTDQRKAQGPSESELKPPVALADRLLVIAWVAILVPAVAILASLVPQDPSPTELTEELLRQY